ncbi:MAG: hypothetical protein E7773_10560 [Sphingomonas sp.]|uniref:hypothetical protein n=1 Tax=Sphingomonas sp. TaxID=28214 RepID=UPI0011FB95A3|nr:hypothetical protein [Sphingomonas sp.]THD35549.1 MAG: hypothetical protein E7773_10560 [Sphingomonas sp.]
MAKKPTIEFDAGSLDEQARQRLTEAARQAGVAVVQPGAGSLRVTPADKGTIETSLSIKTKGLDDDAIDALRAKVFDNARHTRILDSVIKGALGNYGMADDGDLFVQWVWCQWLQYQGEDMLPDNEQFVKRFAIRPPVEIAAGAQKEW